MPKLEGDSVPNLLRRSYTHLRGFKRICVLVCAFVTPLIVRLFPCCRIPKNGNTPFPIHHAADFGLRICERAMGDITSVITVEFRFCEVFGKEEPVQVGRKRGPSMRVG